MKDAAQFPTTTPYGWVKGYPLHTTPSDSLVPPDQKPRYPGAGWGFHTGRDYGCPVGTPILVNKAVIGFSGATGYVIGAHLHVGRLMNGIITDPGDVFNVPGAVVTGIDTAGNTDNGKFVRVRGADGADRVYLHMSVINVSVGQKLGGNVLDDNDIKYMYLASGKSDAEASKKENLDYWRGKKPESLARELYTGNEGFRYKASHYDADVAAAGGEAQKKLDDVKRIIG